MKNLRDGVERRTKTGVNVCSHASRTFEWRNCISGAFGVLMNVCRFD
jgi:hypothetical protein